MALTSKELREKRAGLVGEMRTINAKEKLTAEDTQKWERLNTDVDELRSQIDRLEKLEDLEKDLNTIQNPAPGTRETRALTPEADNDKARSEKRTAAFYDYVRNGMENMRSEHKPYLQEIRSSMTTQTGSTGGYAVPQGFDNRLVEFLKSFNGVRQAPVDVLTTTSGNDIPTPTIDDTSDVGELIGENTQTNNNEIPTLGQVTLKASLFSSKVVLVPIQLLQDNGVDLETRLPEMIGTRIARNQAGYMTTGTGTSQPQGIVTGAGNSGVTFVDTLLPTFDELIDLQHSVDPAYRSDPSCGYMFHDLTLKGLKKVKDSQNRPLWLPGLAVKEPDTINGFPYWVNQNMASPLAASKTIIFGAMRYFRIRDVRGTVVMRLTERYADYFQVGFLGFFRSDSRMLNSAAIKYATTHA